MNCQDVQSAVQKYLHEHSNIYQCLNFSKGGYMEADVFAVTKARIATEVEVKVSKSDFKADFKKTHKHYKLSKRLNETWSKIPQYFYYACPAGLISLAELPEYAGLIYVGVVDSELQTIVMKKAPKLHNEKASDKTIMNMLDNLTSRTVFGCQYLTYKNRLITNRNI